ncbi:MAG TPA: flagellar biosynthetic protein FliR [Novosphingobium sp.]|nr:flagellar biosynthetic protein FliR [Novosphingobium sp.]HZV10066.1 flagellar biosynthetic protein FliR [Novosphingobium sp.]
MPGLHFGFGALEADFWRWAFLMTRIGAALVGVPFFSLGNVPTEVRVILAAAVAALVAGWTGAAAPADLLSLAGMLAVAGEVLVGLMLGFVLQIAFAGPVIAAELIGGGMGMGLAASVDPTNGAHSPALGQFFGVILTLIFLGLGGHLQWFALLVRSYDTFPPGHTWLGPEHFRAVAGFASAMFATAVAMALPVSLVLLLVQLMAGILSRSAPALNLFSLGLPAAICAGFAALLASLPLLGDRLTTLSADAIAACASLTGG